MDAVTGAFGYTGRFITRRLLRSRGWPKLATTAQQDKWIRDFSDHGLLYFEVQRA